MLVVAETSIAGAARENAEPRHFSTDAQVSQIRKDSLLHGLNTPQRDAVVTLRGPLLVLAGAGTGKTRVVTFRIANLIKHGTQGDRILAVTFTNKAAGEMKERVAELLGKKEQATPVVSTFHSYCVQILRRRITHLGYPAKFAIYDRGDQESIARTALREIRVSDAALKPGDLLYFISRWKSSAIRPPQAASVAETDKEHLAAAAYRRYQQALKLAGAVDFDDLLLLTEELFSKHEDVRREEASLFDHLLVDEYQDTNGSQYRIVKALAQGHRNLCVVGDDDQSIYGWRGAEVEHILRFAHDWPDAKVVRLEDNYRSKPEILEVSNRLIAFNTTRHPKVLRAARPTGERPQIWQCENEELEAKKVVGDIQQRILEDGDKPRDFAILFRTNEQPRIIEQMLRKAKLPYLLVGGMSFFDRKEVRDILSYVRLLDDPGDEVSLRRVINTPPRGIGPSAVETLLGQAVQDATSLWNVMPKAKSISGLSSKAASASMDFVRLIEQFQQRVESSSRESLVDVVRALIAAVNYEGELIRLYPEEEDRSARWAAVEQVVSALGMYEKNKKKPTIRGFLDEILLSGRDFDNDKSKELERDAIALMTLHAAKGLQFKHVYMVGMEEGLLPHHRSVAVEGAAIEEERRLCYVGLTRAEDRLTLSLALTRMKWGKPRETIPSRFLFELTGQAERAAAAEPRRSKLAARPKKPTKTVKKNRAIRPRE